MLEFLVNNLLILISISSGLVALLLIVLLTPVAKQLRLLDEPSARKKHSSPVPMVGGISICLTVLAALSVIDAPEKLAYLSKVGSVLVLVGLLDDVFVLGIKSRLFAQVLATLLMLLGMELWVTSVGIEWFGIDSLGFFGPVLTIIAVVGMTNAFNLVDGIDGLAAGHAIIGVVLIGIIMWFAHGEILHVESLLIFVSSCLAFWLVNMSLTPFKKVFLGDAGSLYLGFMIGWMLIYFSQEPIAKIEPVAALWCVAFPVWDTLVVMARRIKNGRSVFAPDRQHFHHLLVDMGMRSVVALSTILVISTMLSAFGIWMTYVVSPAFSMLMHVVFFLIFLYLMLHPSIDKRLALKLRSGG